MSEVMVNGLRGVWVERDGGEEIRGLELQRERTRVSVSKVRCTVVYLALAMKIARVTVRVD
ncbi:MAG: hypothetical protein H0U03_01115 [Actinobacteria bacterium]|nr:hypothetical protein [Actinomycetota bacterium]